MIQIPTESVTWSGSRNQPARKIIADILYTDTSGLNFTEISEGDTVLFKWEKRELFRGVVFNRLKTQQGTLKLTAYDTAQYLLLNQDVYTFDNQRADQILTRICRDFEISTGSIVNTGATLTETHLTPSTLYDIILQALTNTEKTNGRRFQLRSVRGKITLSEWGHINDQWFLATGSNIKTYNSMTSIENTATRVKLTNTDDENTITATANDNAGRQRYGVIQHFERVAEDLNQGQLNERARTTLNDKKGIERILDITALGIADCISGVPIQIRIPDISARGTRFIDSDTHHFKGESHEMDLSLVEREE